ncbi:hypothetical protein FLSI110296_12270 [Flavobacterium sinopsychrotolerans]|jgi:hypothetical protein|uniref:Uncharacterized protein n=1 Tax=Flavobacterium limicola TaxID=180441 RepID=A0A495S574_9FLAO|nr:hypothetical protein BC952_0080 [Flavobacterium limicola]
MLLFEISLKVGIATPVFIVQICVQEITILND